MRSAIFFLLLMPVLLPAQAPVNCTASGIAPVLRAQAHAVVRLSETVLTVTSASDMEERRRQVVTILDQQGLEHARFVLPYDRFETLRDISLSVLDAGGQPVEAFRRKDFKDEAYLDDLTMASDARYLTLDLSNQKPPFTFDLQYTVKSKGTFVYPDFIPQFDYHISVEKARLEVRMPADLPLRYKCERSPEPVVSNEGKSVTYRWSFQNLPAIPDEPFNLPVSRLTPAVWLSPAQFEIDGYSGSFDSWDGLALWNQSLLNALPPLAEPAVRDIRTLTGGLPERERIRAVYRYLQNSTRYVSIQLGIGGWQPFDPNLVHTKKYGDCKALSWYALSLLKAAGVHAYYTLIDAGNYPRALDPAFPHNVFNHVILTVPTGNGDTVWLECTSQTNPFGYLGAFTGNRKALMLDNGKARVIQTPSIPVDQNVRTDSVRVHLPADSKTAQLHWQAAFDGMAIEADGFDEVIHMDMLTQRKWIEKQFAVKGGQIDSFAFQLDALQRDLPAGRVEVLASTAQLLNITPKRLYFQPNFFQPWKTALDSDSARVSPVFRRFGNTYVADLSLTLPAGWSAESLPAPVEAVTPFGTYIRSVEFAGGTLHYRRSITLHDGVFPPETFNDLAAFSKKMKKWDGESAVFVRSE